MRVALLSYRSKPHCGGQGVYVRHLSRELAALGHDVEVFSGQPYPVLDPGVRLTKVPSLDLYREPDPFRTPRPGEFRDLVDLLEVATMWTAGFPEPRTFSLRAARLLKDRLADFDVDALFDGDELFLGGVMEHIEEAGIHSGDSSCALPPITLGAQEVSRIREATEAIARGIGVRGLLNIQYALGSDVLYVLEANPRASRTVPFVSKATATPLASAAARVMLGETIADLRGAGLLPAEGDGGDLPGDAPIAVKEAVMPFNRFRTPDGRNVDTVLGPEMKSTGEVMGFDADFGTAFAKAQTAAFGSLPTTGKVFVSMANRDKRTMIFPIKVLADRGFEILATQGTAEVLRRNGVRVTVVRKHFEGPGPNGEPTTVQLIQAGEIDLVINTPHGSSGGGSARIDGYEIRTAAVMANIPCITTVQGLGAAVQGIEALRSGDIGVRSLQDRARA